MMRWLGAVALGAMVALTFSVGSSVDAEAKKKAAPKSKACVATNTTTGKKVSWRCAATESCCYNSILNKSSCSPANASGFCL